MIVHLGGRLSQGLSNRSATLWLVGMSGLLAGCPLGVVPPNEDGGQSIVDGNRDPSLTSPLGKTAGEPNGDFAQPIVAVFDAQGVARLQGTVARNGDIDVYLLGPLNAGDRVTVDAYATGSSLDTAITMFDNEERLVLNNDDRDEQTLDSYVDFIVRHAGERYYLAVSHFRFAANRERSGAYRVDIQLDSGFEVPLPVAQTLFLDFDGAVVNSPVLAPNGASITLAPFDAGAIASLYEGQTQTIKDQIVEVMIQNYERFDVTVVSSDDPLPAAGTGVSTIYFGGFDQSVFGIAEDVDEYNIHRCDDALIFAKTFTPAVFSGIPSATQLGTAIANVAAHEAGHLLGLNHTDDDTDLMDDQSPADAFLQDQEFKSAPLSSDIMLLGVQDGVLLLNEIVGPREDDN